MSTRSGADYDYLFVGAGFFSATAANVLTGRGKRCLIIDRRNHIAGNCFTGEQDGINIHTYGAHIFHTDNRDVWSFVNKFADFNKYINSPIANFNGRLYNLPFNMNTFCRIWPGVVTPSQARERIAEQSQEITATPQNLEEQAVSLVGRDIYELLIKGYTEKQWGRSCVDLPASIIKRIPVRFIYDNNYYDDRYQGIPAGGYTRMIDKMLAGTEVRLNCDYFTDKDALDNCADKIIFTGMIDEFFGCRFGKLAYRTLRFEHESLAIPNYQGNAVINYTDSETPYTRIIEHKHFEFGTQPSTVITKEFPAEYTPGCEPYYPVNDDANTSLYNKYHALAKSLSKVIFGGRLGTYRYLDMDDTVEAALSLASTLP
ncbi:MAG: UDP-galactopyranose mutase [Chitinispirillia bacterium]|nr:UDP-galactopyranose mutase [Chitinispirillia bacterium]MCL2240991.1 UDP-galactopyranose mutase [Chitinispirillia bacterium]